MLGQNIAIIDINSKN